MTLGGNVVIRNGIDLDYCFVESIRSLLPICDEVVCCDADSTDGTRQVLDELAAVEPKIKICNWAWPEPVGRAHDWFVTWFNYAREHLHTDWHIQLDADEVLHENSHEEVLQAVRYQKTLVCKRYNFWRDHRNLIPPGHCCGHEVIRVGPQRLWMPTDCPDPRGKALADLSERSNVEIFHYGFIRRPEAFFSKERLLQRYYFNSYDPRLERAQEKYEKEGANWMDNCEVGYTNNLVPFTGTHPRVAHSWLRGRGYWV
jgi:glycosyltransferase involved in cell wall biosynthesis